MIKNVVANISSYTIQSESPTVAAKNTFSVTSLVIDTENAIANIIIAVSTAFRT